MIYTTTLKFLSHKVETSVFDGFGDSQTPNIKFVVFCGSICTKPALKSRKSILLYRCQ